MPEIDYIKQLESQNEELKQKLGEAETKLVKYQPKRLKHSPLFGNIADSASFTIMKKCKLIEKIHSLPGLEVISTAFDFTTDQKLHIWFNVIPSHDNVGLFILTRCVDNRYWIHGIDWSIHIHVSDLYDGVLPTAYCLSCNADMKTALNQADSLVDNIDHHLKHENFLKGYDITHERLKESI